MKVKTALLRVWSLVAWAPTVTAERYVKADLLLKKYQKRYGYRHFNQHLRTVIKNGLWENRLYQCHNTQNVSD